MTHLLTGFTLFVAASAGDVYVPDGGRLVISGTLVDLAGIDAPAANSEAGREARQVLQTFTDGKTIICRIAPRNGQSMSRVGVCFADGEDIGALLITSGVALDCPRTSAGRYSNLEPDDSRIHLKQRGDCQIALK